MVNGECKPFNSAQSPPLPFKAGGWGGETAVGGNTGGWSDGLLKGGGLVYIRIMRPVIIMFSLFHRLGCRIRNAMYEAGLLASKEAPLPVVSVGNVSFGGSEKTPLALELLRHLEGKNIRPALITRGYRGRWERTGGVLSRGGELQGSWRDSGDEPYMVALNLPEAGVYIGKDRLASCRMARSDGFQVAVLDDGFQHRRLRRDLDIVLFDPDEKIRLREPVSALKRAHAVFIKQDHPEPPLEKLTRRFPAAQFFSYRVVAQDVYSVTRTEASPLTDWEGKTVLAFCGIARPERFFKLLDSHGVHPGRTIFFADHHPYSPRDIARIKAEMEESGAQAAITTEKDAVKLSARPDCQDLPLYYIKIALDIDPAFFEYMHSRIGTISCA